MESSTNQDSLPSGSILGEIRYCHIYPDDDYKSSSVSSDSFHTAIEMPISSSVEASEGGLRGRSSQNLAYLTSSRTAGQEEIKDAMNENLAVEDKGEEDRLTEGLVDWLEDLPDTMRIEDLAAAHSPTLFVSNSKRFGNAEILNPQATSELDVTTLEDNRDLKADEDPSREQTGKRLNTIPLCVSTQGPPEVSVNLRKGIMMYEFDDSRDRWRAYWKVDPDINIITNMIRPYSQLCGLPNDNIKVEFLDSGSWNKVYTVASTDKDSNITKECIFRCPMPDWPWYSMQLEMATMEYIRYKTTIPVPRVFAFDSSMNNELGLEWVLMEKVQGVPYEKAERFMGFEAKVRLYRTIADWVDQMYRLEFDKMGCIFRDWSRPLDDNASYRVGPLKSGAFLEDLHLDFKVYRGPFTSKQQYISSRVSSCMARALDPRMEERARSLEPAFARKKDLAKRLDLRADVRMAKRDRRSEEMHEREAKAKYMSGQIRVKPIPEEWKVLDEPLDYSSFIDPCMTDEISRGYPYIKLDDLREVAKHMLNLVNCLPIIFGDEYFKQGSTSLEHGDIHEGNILVDSDGKAVALLDWERASAWPREWCSRYPVLIDTSDDYSEPEPWNIIGPMDLDTAAQWYDWERVLLRREFDKRLEELESPYLQQREEDTEDDDIILDKTNRIWCCWQKDKFIPELWQRHLKKFVSGCSVSKEDIDG